LHGLSLFLGKQRGMLQLEVEQEQVRQALLLPAAVSNVLNFTDEIDKLAEKYSASSNFLFLGRGLGYPVALEGALKLKEVSYIHAEGYSAGEMKHGPIALIDDQMPTLAICTQGDVHDKMRSNIQQIRARGGAVIALVSEGDSSMDAIATDTLIVPDIDPILSPIPAIVALQLFSYGIATRRGADVDQPRNLAKTVTVE
jgi:glucosamine--fructose-6-phosphate aminotransferase (isomerizing)